MDSEVLSFSNRDKLIQFCEAYNAIDSAVAVIDDHVNIVYQNPAFKEVSTPRTKILALTIKEHLILGCSSIQETLQKIFSSNEPCDIEIKLPYTTDLFIPLRVKLSPISIDNNTNHAMLSISKDCSSNNIKSQVERQEKLKSLATQVKKLSKDNIEQNNLIRSLLGKTPFGMMVIDEDQKILQANKAAQEILNTSSSNTLGNHCSDYFNCIQLHDNKCPVLQENRDIQQQETSTCNFDSTDKILLKSSTKIKFNNRTAVLESFIDITDKMKYEDDLMDAVIQAEKTNVLKSEFLANMSHELRTPLHAILGFSKLGEQKTEANQDKINTYFKKIGISGNTLLNLLNNLLDLSKLEAKKMPLNFSKVNLNEHIQHVIDELQPLLDDKTLTVSTDLFNCSGCLEVNPEKIKQVLRNLINNSIKFSPEQGNIRISTAMKNDNVEFIIEDDGPGIPKNELNDVFEKFIQSSKTKTGAGGTGLGLSICKEIIHLHHGEIFASESDKGAKFIFRLPLNLNSAKSA